jgi:hypothetical protein
MAYTKLVPLLVSFVHMILHSWHEISLSFKKYANCKKFIATLRVGSRLHKIRALLISLSCKQRTNATRTAVPTTYFDPFNRPHNIYFTIFSVSSIWRPTNGYHVVGQRNIIGFLSVDALFHTTLTPSIMQDSISSNSISLTVALDCMNPCTISQVVELRSKECYILAKQIFMLTLKMSLYFGWHKRVVLQDFLAYNI